MLFYFILKIIKICRWFHGRCEGHGNEEAVENAADNSFRCSFCRPQSFCKKEIIFKFILIFKVDALNIPVVIDNVMVSKSMAEQLNGGVNTFRRLAFIGGINEHVRSLASEQGF